MTQQPPGHLPPAPPVVPPPPPAPRPPSAAPSPQAPPPPSAPQPRAARSGSRLQRWRLPVALAVGLLVLTGAIGWAVLVSAHRSTSAPVGLPTSAVTAAPATPGATPSPTKAPRVRGTITAESEASWTLTTATGKTLTVRLGKGTKFGTEQAPALRAQFPVGTAVVVTGTEKDGVIQAKRIAAATPASASTTTTSSR